MPLSPELHVAIWLFLAAFLLHDGEEILTVSAWMKRHRGHRFLRLEPATRLLSPQKSITGQFAIAVVFLACLVGSICYLAASGTADHGITLFAGAVSVLLLDGIKHIGITLLFGAYTPGVVTAALVEVPYAVWTAGLLVSQSLITWETLLWAAGGGLLAIGVLLVIALLLGRTLMPRTGR